MKIKLLSSLMVLVFFAIFAGCSKSDTEEAVVSIVGSFSAKVDGVEWKATIAESAGIKYNDYITITGIKGLPGTAEGESILITINAITTGTYALKLNVEGVDIQAFSSYQTNLSAEPDATNTIFNSYEGSVTLSELNTTDKRMSGTFTFKAKNSASPSVEKVISEGVFKNLKYTDQSATN